MGFNVYCEEELRAASYELQAWSHRLRTIRTCQGLVASSALEARS